MRRLVEPSSTIAIFIPCPRSRERWTPHGRRADELGGSVEQGVVRWSPDLSPAVRESVLAVSAGTTTAKPLRTTPKAPAHPGPGILVRILCASHARGLDG